ncbi:MAG: hypothetical protein FRX49_03662 [Trebouxia sp. A1-2]|nr:MAG: hypothetical protein FRX49_03662 [Trebouxia sp. A1-2]
MQEAQLWLARGRIGQSTEQAGPLMLPHALAANIGAQLLNRPDRSALPLAILRRQEYTCLRVFREDDGEGLSPVSLTGKQPVSEFVVDLLPASACLLQPSQHLLLSFLLRQPIQIHSSPEEHPQIYINFQN